MKHLLSVWCKVTAGLLELTLILLRGFQLETQAGEGQSTKELNEERKEAASS